MAYKVIGATAVVEFDDGNEELNTGRKIYLEEGSVVPDGVKDASVEHLLAVGLIAETDEGDKPARKRAAAKDDSES